MKKSTVAVGVIVALGVVWTGGAWFTGKTAEAEYQRQIELTNQKMAMLGTSTQSFDVRIENVKFERGLFSSEVSYDVSVKSLTDGAQSWVFPLEGKVYHGPLPLNRLSRFDLVPAMFSASTQVTKNDDTQVWFDAVQGKNPLTATATMSYGQRIKGDIQLAAGEVKLQGVDSAWSDVSVVYDTDKNGEGRYEYRAAKVKSLFNREALEKYAGIHPEDNLNSMDIDLTGLEGVYDLQPTELPKIFIGTHNGIFAGLKYAYTYKDGKVPPIQLEFKNWAFDYVAAQKDAFLNYGLKNKVESVNFNNHSLGQLQFDMQLNHLDAKTTNSLVETAAQNQAAFEQAGLELLKHQPHLRIAPLALTNADGKLDSSLNIELADVDFAKALQGKFLSLFKQLDIRMSADKAAMTNMISVLQQVGGKAKEEADKIARQQVDDYVQEAVHEGSVIDSGKSISASLVLENGELKFNGNVIPEEYIGMFLMGLMMQQ